MPRVVAVMVHVSNPAEGLRWYERAFAGATRKTVRDPEFEFLEVDGVRIEVVQADSKVSSGPAGTVVYWSVDNFDLALDRFLALGATLFRGPMLIEDSQRMCQVRDPWGNCIGLRGK